MKGTNRSNGVASLIVSQFCPKDVEEKNQLASKLKSLYQSQEQFPELAKGFEELDRITTAIAEGNSTIKLLGTKIRKLEVANISKLRQEALTHHIQTTGLNDDNLRTVLIGRSNDTIKSITADLAVANEMKDKLVPLRDNFNKEFSKYCKAKKAEFRAWKNANLPQNKPQIAALRVDRKKHKKETSEYCVITNQITSLEDPSEHLFAAIEKSGLDEFTKETYRIRVRKDQISSRCTRFSDSDKVVGTYVKSLLGSMVDGLVATSGERFKELIAASENPASLQPSVELVDFNVSRFPLSVERSIYETLVDTKDTSPIPEADPIYCVWVTVTKYIKNRKSDKTQKIPQIHKDVVTVIARTLAKFVVLLCSMIKKRFEKTGINTIQRKLIENILDPYYIFAGVEHPKPKPAKQVKKKPAAIKSA